MASTLLVTATELANRIQGTDRRHTLEIKTGELVQLLTSVPYQAKGSLSSADIETLCTLAERVITRIEEHVAGSGDTTGDRRLVERVYEIRRVLEDIDRWRRHYLGGMR